MCALQPLSGKISVVFSLRWSYLAFFVVFLLGSLLCGLANSSKMYIIGRAVAGAGGAGVVSGGLSVIAIMTPDAQRPLFTGLMMSLYSLGTVVAPIIGGAFTTNVTWRWCFLINLPAGAVTVITLLCFFHPPKASVLEGPGQTIWQRIAQVDLVGCGLFIPSIVMILLALQWGGGQYAWNSATVIGLFVGFAGAITVFIIWEVRQGDEAMIPFTLLRGCSVVLSIIFGFLILGSAVIPVYYLPEWFQVVKNADPMRSGVMVLPSVCTQISGAIASGALAKYVRYYNPWCLVGSAFLCIAAGLYTTFTTSTPSSHWIGFQIFQGLGCGFAAQMPLLIVQNVLKDKPAHIPTGISTVLFAQYFGSSVAQSVGGAIFQNRLGEELRSRAGLDASQVSMLLDAGTSKVQETVNRAFPDRRDTVAMAYNNAITDVFVSPLNNRTHIRVTNRVRYR
ncbi:major facilitator superfamily [Aspergillus avenaceus]|uniref:Major facilitator superfamily n=1 Tax=Aspergillus avenaceus TaxID=36643 RepID=A0A5N6TKS1_ASPAV|nr:major facilitator superfamily [Aspergillus avenaceus]